MTEKSDRMEPLRLAKKLANCARAEKQALIAIADTCSMRDGVCRKSVTTLSGEFGIAARSFHYGVHGRKRSDGSERFPGLLKRKIIFVKAGGRREDGVPTAYGINIEVLRDLVFPPDTSAQSNGNLCTNKTEPLHNGAETSAQMSQNLCTKADKVQSRCTEGATCEVQREREAATSHSPEKIDDSHLASPDGSPCSSEKPKAATITSRSIDEVAELVMKIAKRLDKRVQFSKTAKRELQTAINKLRIHTGRTLMRDEVEHAVKLRLDLCNDNFSLAQFGGTLAANLVSDVETYRERKAEKQARIDAEAAASRAAAEKAERAERESAQQREDAERQHELERVERETNRKLSVEQKLRDGLAPYGWEFDNANRWTQRKYGVTVELDEKITFATIIDSAGKRLTLPCGTEKECELVLYRASAAD